MAIDDVAAYNAARLERERREREAYDIGRRAREQTGRSLLGRESGGIPGYISASAKRNRSLVRQIQQELKRLGLYKGSIDGIWGPKTDRAYWQATMPAQMLPKPGQASWGIVPTIPYASARATMEANARQLQRDAARTLKQYNALKDELARAKFISTKGGLAGGLFGEQARAAQFALPGLEKARRDAEEAQARYMRETTGWRGVKNNLLGQAGKALSALGKPYEVAIARPMAAIQAYNEAQRRAGQDVAPFAREQLLAGAFGAQRFIKDPAILAALTSTQDPEARKELVESPGQYLSRSLDEVGLQVSAFLGSNDAKKQLADPTRGLRKSYQGEVGATVIDVALNLFADPLNALGPIGKLGKIDTAVKAAKFLGNNPAAGDALLNAVADAATRAAARGGGAELGDARYLQALVPSLKAPEAAGLAGALVVRNVDEFVDYVRKTFVQGFSDDAGRFGAAGLSTRAAPAAQAGAAVRAAATKLADEVANLGKVTPEARKALLKLALGRQWRPDLSPLARAVPKGLSLARPAAPQLVDRALAGMPTLTREVKRNAWVFQLSRAGLQKGAGRLANVSGKAPGVGALTRYARRTKGEDKLAKELFKASADYGKATGKAAKSADVGRAARLGVLEGVVAGLGNSRVKDMLLDRAVRVKGLIGVDNKAAAGQLRSLTTDVSRILAAGPEYYQRLQRNLEIELRDWNYVTSSKVTPRFSKWRKSWLAVSRTFSLIPANQINMHNEAERAQVLSDWVIGMGGTREEADEAFSRMLRPMSVEEALREAKSISAGMIRLLLRRSGLSPGEVKTALAEMKSKPESFFRNHQGIFSVIDDFARRTNPFVNEHVYDVDGAKSAQQLSQRQYTLPLADPADIRRYVRMAKLAKQDWHRIAEMGALGAHYAWELYYRTHRAFKVIALTGAPIRYMGRILMDERLRMYLEHGWAGFFLPPGRTVRKLNANRLDDTRGLQHASHFHEIGIENHSEQFIELKGVKTAGSGVIVQGEEGFAENAWNVWLRQVRPEDDMLHELFMRYLHTGNGYLRQLAWDDAKAWLTSTPDGRKYLEDAINMNKANKNLDRMLQRTEDWLTDILPNRAAVEARLRGPVSLAEYKANPTWHPTAAWGEKYSRLYLPDKNDPRPHYIQLLQRLTIQTPTTALNRQPFYFREFTREWDALVMGGMDPAKASIEASRRAVRSTNQTLFDASQRSRFAQRTDLFSPFAQAREEQIRVWSRLARENPARFAKLVSTVATAFNAGEDAGILEKDYYGDWTMKVPGSPELSRALGRWAPFWKEGFSAIAGGGYSFKLKNLLFMQDIWSVLPRPGGPWWSVMGAGAIKAHPEWLPDNEWAKEYFFGFGASQRIIPRPELAYLYMALTNDDHVFWEPFANGMLDLWPGGSPQEPELKQAYDKLAVTVAAELIKRAVEDGKDPRSVTPEAVKEAVRAQFFLSSMVGMVFPAATKVETMGEEEYQTAIKSYTKADGTVDWTGLVMANPEMIGYAARNTAWKDPVRAAFEREDGSVDLAALKAAHPDYWARWFAKKNGEDDPDSVQQFKDQLTLTKDFMDISEFNKLIAETKQRNDAWKWFWSIQLDPTLDYAEKTLSLELWETSNKAKFLPYGIRLDNYRRDQELDAIRRMPGTADRADALADWQYRWNVSGKTRERLLSGPMRGQDLWLEARSATDLELLFLRKNPKGKSPITFATDHMSPAEQIKFLRLMAARSQDADDYQELQRAAGKVSNTHAEQLYKQGRGQLYGDIRNASMEWWRDKTEEAAAAIDSKYEQISHITEQQQAIIDLVDRKKAAAKAAKVYDGSIGADWRTYYALKDKKNRVYAEIKGIKDALYDKHPVLSTVEQEVKYLHLMDNPEKREFLERFGARRSGLTPLKSWEEQAYENMPEHIQKDYVDTLLERLQLPLGRFVTEEGKSRMQWGWLTRFQQDLVAARTTPRQLDLIKRLSRDAEKADKARGKGGGFTFGGMRMGEGAGWLAFAVEMFKRYNKRGSLAEPTRELAEFKALGDNKTLRAQYLKTHPRLSEWFRLGPMANMPPAMAVTIRFLMQKLGRWDVTGDDPENWDEVTELGFAQYMLNKYNARTGDAPPAYERWLKMPTGPARLKYMQAHPEIERWLQAGPMARMPDEYKEVVRDILGKFSDFEKRTDPLSVLLEQYYNTPTYARQDFLEAHPEIMAYWRAIRTGRERKLFDLAQVYFALPDQEKAAYLRAYPEVREYFAEQRKQAYERFIRRVSVYLGSMPELAEEYLAAQTVFIKELVERFGQRPLIAPTATVAFSREYTGRQPLPGNRRAA